MSTKKRKAPSPAAPAAESSASAPHTPPALPPGRRWRCDICLVALFDTYDEAVAHEKGCTATAGGGSGAKEATEAAASPPAKKAAKKTINVPEKDELLSPEKVQVQILPQTPEEGKNNLSQKSASTNEAPPKEHPPLTNTPNAKTKGFPNPQTQWQCGVCEKATFGDYHAAVAHETTCLASKMGSTGDDDALKGLMELKQPRIIAKEGAVAEGKDEGSPAPIVDAQKRRDGGEKKGAVADGKGKATNAATNDAEIYHDSAKEKSVDAEKGKKDKEAAPAAKDATAGGKGRITTWNCSGCGNKAVFPDYESALKHEQTCPEMKKLREALAKNKRKTNWRCDVCLEAVFEEYEDAVAHEKLCMKQSEKIKKSKKLDAGRGVPDRSDAEKDEKQVLPPKQQRESVTPKKKRVVGELEQSPPKMKQLQSPLQQVVRPTVARTPQQLTKEDAARNNTPQSDSNDSFEHSPTSAFTALSRQATAPVAAKSTATSANGSQTIAQSNDASVESLNTEKKMDQETHVPKLPPKQPASSGITDEVANLIVLAEGERVRNEKGRLLCKVKGCTSVARSDRDYMCIKHHGLFEEAGRDTKHKSVPKQADATKETKTAQQATAPVAAKSTSASANGNQSIGQSSEASDGSRKTVKKRDQAKHIPKQPPKQPTSSDASGEVDRFIVLALEERVRNEKGRLLCKVKGCASHARSDRDYMCIKHYRLFKEAGRETREQSIPHHQLFKEAGRDTKQQSAPKQADATKETKTAQKLVTKKKTQAAKQQNDLEGDEGASVDSENTIPLASQSSVEPIQETKGSGGANTETSTQLAAAIDAGGGTLSTPAVATWRLPTLVLGLISLPAILIASVPLHVRDRVLLALFFPTMMTFTLAIALLIVFAYTSFAFAMIVTHEGTHHHQSKGLLSELYMAAQDAFRRPVASASAGEDKEGPATPPPTLREFLSHPDGFHIAFAPAFFGFFAYFGALAAMEEGTGGGLVVPPPNLPTITMESDDEGEEAVTCGLKSTAGASAGAMAAVMLAAGIQPCDAFKFASKFTWGMVADPPGVGGYVKGNNFEECMRKFISEAAKIRRGRTRNGEERGSSAIPFQLEEALVPVAVSGFDLMRMRGVNLSKGCMAKAARASAGFPGLFQPVAWRERGINACRVSPEKWLPDSLLIDGGITDGLGLNGLSTSSSREKKRIINMVVGDFGFRGPPGIVDMPPGVNAESLVSIAIVGSPMCGPWAMKNGPRAYQSVKQAMMTMLDAPMERGSGDNHFVLRVDASKWLD